MSAVRSTEAKLSPLRILILSPSSSPSSPSLFPPLLHALTGTLPPPHLSEDAGTFAGYTSHPPLALRTKYYEADVGLWCDNLPLPASAGRARAQSAVEGNKADEPVTLAAWKEQILSPAADEVRAAIGGILLLLPYDPVVFKSMTRAKSVPSSPHQNHDVFDAYLELLEVINDVREAIEDGSFGREIATIALVQGVGPKLQRSHKQDDVDAAAERLETELLERKGVFGWDVVGWAGEADPNEQEQFDSIGNDGNRSDKIGIGRVVEALELVNWGATLRQDGAENEDELIASLMGDNDDIDTMQLGRYAGRQDGIQLQSHELEREMMGLRFALHEQVGDEDLENLGNEIEQDASEEDIQVEQLQSLMERVVAIREAGAELGKEEREQFAKREVARIMRDIG